MIEKRQTMQFRVRASIRHRVFHATARLQYQRVIVMAACMAFAPYPGCRAQTPSTNIPYSFQNVAVVAGGFITGIVPHPTAKGLMYLRTDIGGAYRWDESSKTWIPLTDWVSMTDSNLMGVESIAVDPRDSEKLYLSVGTYDQSWSPNGAILRSNDRGRSFEIVRMPFKMGGNQDGRFAGERLAVDPHVSSVLFLGTRNNGLWKSSDGAKTWTQVTSFPGVSTNRIGVVFVLFDPGSGRAGCPTPTIYAGVSSPTASLFRSNDAGATWEAVPGSPMGVLPNHGELGGDGNMYLTYGDAPGPNDIHSGMVMKWNTHTGKWKDISPELPHVNGGPSFGYGGLAINGGATPTLMVSTIDRWNKGDEIFRSTDGGSHWTNLADYSDRDASLSPYIVGEDGKVPLGHWIGAIAIDPFDGDHALYGTGATVWATNDLRQLDAKKTSHWFIGAQGIEETAVLDLLSPPEGAHLWSGLGDIGCFRHEDFSISPREGSVKNPRLSSCESLDYAAAAPDVMVRVGRTWGGRSHGGVSTDNGATWSSFPTEPAGADGGGQVAISADGKTMIWATNKKIVSFSNDDGRHWTTMDASPARAQVRADRVHPNRFYLYDADAATLRVADGPSLRFSPVGLDVPKHGKLFSTPGAPDDLWLTSKAGLWHLVANGSPTSLHLANVQEAYALGFGKADPKSAGSYPTIFLSGKVEGHPGVFRSLDTGRTWQRIDDDEHQYGGVDVVSGDPRVFGRVYLGTNGRGIIWADPKAE